MKDDVKIPTVAEMAGLVPDGITWRDEVEVLRADEKPVGDLTEGLLAMLAGGPLAAGKLAEWEHTVCEDCTAFYLGQFCRSPMRLFHGPDALTKPDGPLWPGCRGFALREGAPGPVKRAHEAAKKKDDEAFAAHKARQEKKP